MTYKHYILTRYNLGLYSPENPYAGKVGDPDLWMQRRQGLFEKYCKAGIVGQTCQDFTWLIAFDPLTPDEEIERLKLPANVEICHEQPHIYLCRKSPEADWLITSRIDNDDMYLDIFVEKLQANFDAETRLIDIDYQVMELETGRRFSSGRARPNSPFVSLIEPWRVEPFTAMGRPHTYMCEGYDSRKLGILALQIIHIDNICNKIPI